MPRFSFLAFVLGLLAAFMRLGLATNVLACVCTCMECDAPS